MDASTTGFQTQPAIAGPPRYPGIPEVINGNGAVARVMSQVCGGVIGYPITPSTEIAELYEAARAEGALNVWGKHPFFFEPEGEHSAQSGALGAALTGGQYISNASSSQGILYAMESHFVTVGKKIGGFVLQVAARVVSKHSLNVMAGHDDVYALLPSGYTVLFGANPQEAADLAAIAYKTSALSLIPVANCMDGFATSHMMSEARMPEAELLREYLGDPAGRIQAPTVAQELLFGAKGRVFQLKQYLTRHAEQIADRVSVLGWLDANAEAVEADDAAGLVGRTEAWIPEELRAQWRRQWRNAHAKGTRARVPALVDPHNPGLTGPVQNQPDFQAGAADHRVHFAADVPALARRAMAEYSELTGRAYAPISAEFCDDADYVMVGLGSVCDDVRAVLPYLRAQGLKVGLVAITLLQPFPEAEVAAALAGRKAVMVLERSDQLVLTDLVTQTLFKAHQNTRGDRYAGIPAIAELPSLTTAIFGLGGHDLQPRHLIAAFRHLADGDGTPLVYLGSQFFDDNASPALAAIQAKLRAAYPETELMALKTEPNPRLLPEAALRIRFHSVGGYGTIATGKLLTDILAGVLGMNSKSAPKYGSEKSGAATNYYITLSPEPVLITNAELEDVEVVVSPDHRVFAHTNPLRGLVEGGTFIMQSSQTPEQVWRDLPTAARRTIRTKGIKLFVIDAFSVAKQHAPTPQLQTRMMGIAFIGAVATLVDRVAAGASSEDILAKVRGQISKKFGSKGTAVVEANMAVIRDGVQMTRKVDYESAELQRLSDLAAPIPLHTVAVSQAMCAPGGCASSSGLFDTDYYDVMTATPFLTGTISEAPVLPGSGLFMPPGTASAKDKGLFRRTVPVFNADLCTGCVECALVCPDAAIPNTVMALDELVLTAIRETDLAEGRAELRAQVPAIAERIRDGYRTSKGKPAFSELFAAAAAGVLPEQKARPTIDAVTATLAAYPVARTRPFFDSMEKKRAGDGGLFAATIDPWKCTGCLECIEVCGPNALTAVEQDAPLMAMLQERFDFLGHLPNTPKLYSEVEPGPGADLKRIFLDHDNYYATTGGHGGCRGCGEVTAIRQVMANGNAIGAKRAAKHRAYLESLIAGLDAKLAEGLDDERTARIRGLKDTLEARLYLYEGGPTGNGPSGTVVANSTGCSSVYASTMPFNAYTDPWVNSLFQDAQPLAKGMFEGFAAHLAGDVVAMRQAALELTDDNLPGAVDPRVSWREFTVDELELLPTVLTIGGDGATYDIGFGALSRLLASGTPVKSLVLNTGAYSNTGGQASTSSFTGQDSDLSRFGKAHSGKQEWRKELGILASFHPNTLVISTATAFQGHFLKNALEFLGQTDLPAVMDVYTPCQSEHGVADDMSSTRARIAVRSRVSPLFVHDPRRGTSVNDWFDLDGNPDPTETWTTQRLEYLDDDGKLQIMKLPLTPADFAFGEGRFAKQFRKLAAAEEASAVLIDAFVELDADGRIGKVPFIWTTTDDKRLLRVWCSPVVVEFVERRRRNWQLLQYLAGQQLDRLKALRDTDVAEVQKLYEAATQQRQDSIDEIARAMAELAAGAPASVAHGLAVPAGAVLAAAPAAFGGAPARAAAAVAGPSAAVSLLEADQSRCTDCKTCYQEMPELFESVTVIVDGVAKPVARMIPGALEKLQITPEVRARIKKIVDNCDAEIIK